MKKLSTLMTMALVAMMALTLTSCDEDYDIAYTLEGTWRGNMYVSSVYDGYTYDATYTELCFVQDPYRYSSGTGYWIDHYAGGRPLALRGQPHRVEGARWCYPHPPHGGRHVR